MSALRVSTSSLANPSRSSSLRRKPYSLTSVIQGLVEHVHHISPSLMMTLCSHLHGCPTCFHIFIEQMSLACLAQHSHPNLSTSTVICSGIRASRRCMTGSSCLGKLDRVTSQKPGHSSRQKVGVSTKGKSSSLKRATCHSEQR